MGLPAIENQSDHLFPADLRHGADASGLCLAFGAYDGAWGAFLLFFANFLTILAVATVIFIAAGFVRRWELGSVARTCWPA